MSDGPSSALVSDPDGFRTIDRQIAHVSTVPAIAGEPVELFLREKLRRDLADGAEARDWSGHVVLMVHGGYWPSVPLFDFGCPGYSWMEALAAAGFDVFVMDMTGYGASSRPLMDDPRNLPPDQQHELIPGTLKDVTQPSHPFKLVTSDSETDDIHRVVETICALRGVERVSLLGWSGGGIRTGTYAHRHPERVDRLVILASSNYQRDGDDTPPMPCPESGYPVTFQTRAVGFAGRWQPNIRCPGQVAPGIQDILWPESIATDPIGAGWGPGGLRAPGRCHWGWTARAAASIRVPSLVMVGEFDRLMPSNIELFQDLGASAKVFLSLDCASHFVAWESQRRVLHAASKEWLQHGTLEGAASGTFRADAAGHVAPQPAV
jgi:pimeloyl-ACP methyl ester carboxylesterase